MHLWCAAGSWHVAMLTPRLAMRYSLLAVLSPMLALLKLIQSIIKKRRLP
jgi:hypothetical protein